MLKICFMLGSQPGLFRNEFRGGQKKGAEAPRAAWLPTLRRDALRAPGGRWGGTIDPLMQFTIIHQGNNSKDFPGQEPPTRRKQLRTLSVPSVFERKGKIE